VQLRQAPTTAKVTNARKKKKNSKKARSVRLPTQDIA